MYELRIRIAQMLVEIIRRVVVPSGNHLKYILNRKRNYWRQYASDPNKVVPWPLEVRQ